MSLQLEPGAPAKEAPRPLFYGELAGDSLRLTCAACNERVKVRHLGLDPQFSRFEVACSSCGRTGIYNVG